MNPCSGVLAVRSPQATASPGKCTYVSGSDDRAAGALQAPSLTGSLTTSPPATAGQAAAVVHSPADAAVILFSGRPTGAGKD